MSIYDDPRAVDRMAAQAVAEEIAAQVAFDRKVNLVADAISRVKDVQTQLALAVLLTLFTEEIRP